MLSSLAGGGAERMIAHLVNHLDREAFDPRIGVLWRDGAYLRDVAAADLLVPTLAHGWIPYHDPPPWYWLALSIAVVPLQQAQLIARFRPHVLVTATKSMNLAARFALPLAGRRGLSWIVREGNNTGAMIDGEETTTTGRRVQDHLVSGSYRRADRVIAISHGVANALEDRFRLDRKCLRTVFNAVDLATVRRRARETPPHQFDRPAIVAAGRLVAQKGFDLLLRAFARHAPTDVELWILGEGPQRGALEQLARELDVGDRLHLPGFVSNPWSYFARAALFVSASRWEGFGNVIIEAMAAGAPVLVTDCDFGPREIVTDRRDGWLVPVEDERALGTAMVELLAATDERARLAAAGRDRADAFSVPAMARAYEAIFRELRASPSAAG